MQVHAHSVPIDVGLTAPLLYGVGSAWWMVEVLAQHGPSWEALGPILLGLAAIYNARVNLELARRGR